MAVPFTLPRPFCDPSSKDDSTQFPLDGKDFHTISDETLVALYDSAPILHRFGGVKIVRLSQTLVLKGGDSVLPCEPKTVMFVSEHTQISIPKVYRIINVHESRSYWGTTCLFVMDYIKGECLAECWESLDGASRSKITIQVADMISQMQSVKMFTDYGAGPFSTLEEMEDWFNHKLEICNKYRQSIQGIPEFMFDKLVLTHQDISPRNLILHHDGRVSLIDWELAGAYPPGFELAALLEKPHFRDFSEGISKNIDDYPVVRMQLRSIRYGLTTAALA